MYVRERERVKRGDDQGSGPGGVPCHEFTCIYSRVYKKNSWF